MVVEHVVTVGQAIGKTLVFLSRGQDSPMAFASDALRPRGARGVAVMGDFRAFADEYPQLVARDVSNRSSQQTHAHPWLGVLGLHQWHCLAALHLRAHRRQLAEIRRRLSQELRRGRLPAVLAAEFDPQS
jgi:hypothetical protein